MDAWTQVLVEHGLVLHALRRELVASLEPHAAAAHRDIGGTGETLTLAYEPSGGENLAGELAAARDEELRRRVTFIGPHRDEVALAINGLPAARFASEGQQRTIALALKLAQAAVLTAQCGRFPLLLMDDIFGELDPRRRNALLRALPADSQKLITTTHLHWLDNSFRPDAVWHVAAGQPTTGSTGH